MLDKMESMKIRITVKSVIANNISFAVNSMISESGSINEEAILKPYLSRKKNPNNMQYNQITNKFIMKLINLKS